MSPAPNPADYWLDAYAADHRHPLNKALHRICVPFIVVSVIGLLWSIPVPAEFRQISPALNWGTTLLLASVVYYFIISIPLAIGMTPIILLIVVIVDWLDGLAMPLWMSSAGIFIIAWAGQLAGHAAEGKRPSFLRDLQLLMIGPLWLLAELYKKLGIPY